MNPYNPNTTITWGLTLYSKWEKIDIEPERSGNNTINKIEYTINHYIENLSWWYTLQASEKSNASAWSKVTPDRKTYEWFSTPSAQTVTITTGATITYKYSRNKYKVTIEKGEWISQVQWAWSYKYWGTVKLSATPLSWYKFTWFEGDVKTTTFAMPAKDISVKATAEKNTTIYTIKYDLNWWKLAKWKNNPSSFTPSSASFTLNPPTKSWYIFAWWIETIDGKTIWTKTYVFILFCTRFSLTLQS